MADENGKIDPTEKELRDRLSSLDERLERRKADRAAGGARKTDGSGFANALRLSSEFVSAILVGAGLGYLLDRLAGTSPWAMIVLLLLGFAAGVVNVLRASGQMAGPQTRLGDTDDKDGGKAKRPAAASRDDDDADDW